MEKWSERARKKLDRYGAVGWGRTEPAGSTTRGAEPRLVLPLDPGAAGDLIATIEVEARDGPTSVVVVANEVPVATCSVGEVLTEVRVRIPSGVVRRFDRLEIALRRPGRLRRRGPVRVRLRRLRVDRA